MATKKLNGDAIIAFEQNVLFRLWHIRRAIRLLHAAVQIANLRTFSVTKLPRKRERSVLIALQNLVRK